MKRPGAARRTIALPAAASLLLAAAAVLLVAGRAHAAAPPPAAATTAPAAPGAVGDDHLNMERTKIIGNRELPKVLYIVPWKKPQPGELPGRPMKSVLDEALEPIDRDVFRTQVRYAAQLATPAAKPEPDHH